MPPVVFGPFEWDATTLELRRKGARVRLPRQPAEVLKVLVDHPGQLVTRDLLRQRLWGDDTFVDFEQGLNTAVARLRQALGDSADDPRYIETVPGGGYRFVGEIQDRVATPRVEPPLQTVPRIDRRTWLAGGLGAAAGLAGAYLLGGSRFAETNTRRGRFVLSAAPAEPLQLSGYEDVAIAPDGSAVVYASSRGGSPALYLRSLRETEGRFLPGTDVFNAFFSPDGMEIGYYRFPDQALVRVSRLGGGSSIVTAGIGVLAGASWSSSGYILYGTRFSAGGLMRIPASGGQPEVVTHPSAGEIHALPDILPGDRAALFTILPEDATSAPPEIAVVDLATGEYELLLHGVSPRFAASGHLVFALEDRLMAVSFDPERRKVTGTPQTISNGIVTSPRGAAQFALSRTGAMVLAVSGSAEGRSVVWVGRDGTEEAIDLPARRYTYPRISPDGARAAVSARDGQSGAIVVWDFERERLIRMTPTSGGMSIYPTWSPDGNRLAFFADRPTPGLYWKTVDAVSEPEMWSAADGLRAPYFFTPSGRELVFARQSTGGVQLCLSTAAGDDPVVLLENARNAALSPDGARLVYQADIDGQFDIFVRSFPSVELGYQQVSTQGGVQPVWSPSGDEVFYVEPGPPARLMSASFTQGSVPQRPAVVMDWPYYIGELGRTYDLSRPDGDRFIAVKQRGSPLPRVEIVLDWLDELKAVMS